MRDTSSDEISAWCDQMRRRTFRQFDATGSTPTGWHVLLPGGDFGFLDVHPPRSAEEHALLVQEARSYMRQMSVRACLFAAERELADGRPVVLLQLEAVRGPGARERRTSLYRIQATPDGRRIDEQTALEPNTAADIELASTGLFPDLLPEPTSPLRIL